MGKGYYSSFADGKTESQKGRASHPKLPQLSGICRERGEGAAARAVRRPSAPPLKQRAQVSLRSAPELPGVVWSLPAFPFIIFSREDRAQSPQPLRPER